MAGAAGYLGSTGCKNCHEEEYQLWAQSHHALAERAPGTEVDEKCFPTASDVQFGATGGFVRKRGASYELVRDTSKTNQDVFQIERLIGVSPLRQFLVAFPGGRLQALDTAYDCVSNQWFSVYGNEGRRPGEWGHWTGRGMNWNSMCAGCHNTGVRKKYSEALDAYATTMAERGVGCEACHGPLKAHNEWQQQFGKSGRKDPTLIKLNRSQVTDNCGFCHARRSDLTGEFRPGDPLLDHLSLELPGRSRLFYSDGQVREEDYEYAAFLGSRMHVRGVQCGDCHNPHSAKVLLPGNWLCMRCHNGTYPNAPVIEPTRHSHHKVFGYDENGAVISTDLLRYASENVKETGGECVNCHMPQTVYMQRHWRHNHGFTIPDPLLTKEAGIPNACNRCHREKDAEWALGYCNAWYDAKMERSSRQRTRTIELAIKNDPAAPAALLAVLATNEIGYWRAVAAGLLEGWASESAVRQALLSGLNETNALVRIECARALEAVAALPQIGMGLGRCLEDPVRGVRIAAAWALRENLDLSSKTGKELLHCLAINADQPTGQMQLGAFALARSKPTQAAEHYRKAVDWDPNSALIRNDYAVVLSQLNQPRAALEQLQAACRLEPTNAEFQYKLALAWNELGEPNKTIECLQTAVRLDPRHARAWYNLGLALNSTAQTEAALQALAEAESVDPRDPRIAYARATILAQLGRLEEARAAARRVLQIDADFVAARKLLEVLAEPQVGSH